ncbi:hypothetical protein WAI453_011309 [Rhynchosporium graminicola]
MSRLLCTQAAFWILRTVLAITKVDVSAAPTKFRTHDIGDDFKDIKMWEVARATSAATTFFPSISCGLQEIEFIDAGFCHNNLTEVVFSEAGYIFSDEPCDCVISIGTGHGDVVEVTNARLSILNASKKMASHSEAVHRRVWDMLPEGAYFSKISTHTSNYLREPFVEKAVRQCASILTQDSFRNPVFVRPMYVLLGGTLIAEAEERRTHEFWLAYVLKLQLNIPPQVLLSDPVFLYTALDDYLSFHLDWVSSSEFFELIVERHTHHKLESQYKSRGAAKIAQGQLVLRGLPTRREHCGTHYERFLELDNDQDGSQTQARKSEPRDRSTSEHTIQKSGAIREISDRNSELKRVGRRVTSSDGTIVLNGTGAAVYYDGHQALTSLRGIKTRLRDKSPSERWNYKDSEDDDSNDDDDSSYSYTEESTRDNEITKGTDERAELATFTNMWKFHSSNRKMPLTQ